MRRRHRLTNRRQFTSLRRQRIAAASGCLRVQAAANGVGVLRAGFAITGLKRAIDRNTVRRRLRALLLLRLGELQGLDVLVAAGPAATSVTFAQLGTELGECLARVVPRARLSGTSTGHLARRVRDNGAPRPATLR